MEPKIAAFMILMSFFIPSLQADLAVEPTSPSTANGYEEMMPVMDENVKKMEFRGMFNMSNISRRKLGSFQICAVCTCCGGIARVCISSPCCYSINCHMPNRPFGYCSFTPKTCNCFGCHL